MNHPISSAPTERIKRQKQRFLDRQPQMCCQRAEIYTRVYRQYEQAPQNVKRAQAFLETMREIDLFMDEDELILGHPASRPRSAEVFPEINFQWMNELNDFETRACNRLEVDEETKRRLQAIHPYWAGKNPADKFRVLRPKKTQLAVDCGLLSNPHEFSGLGHVALDVEKLLQIGVEGIRKEIEEKESLLDIVQPDYYERISFYMAGRKVLEGMLIYAKRCSQLAAGEANKTSDPLRKEELINLSRILAKVPLHKAESFHEAIQSFWLLQVLAQLEENGYSITPGRFDQIMFPYYRKDIESGAISREFAQELLDCLWLKLCEIIRVDSKLSAEINAGYPVGQNLCIGGINASGKDASNELSFLCLEANRHIGLNQPNFTVRLHKNTPDAFLSGVVESISGGNGMPQILNDEVIVPSLLNRGFPLSLARNYTPVGCDESTVKGQWGRCNGGLINFAKVLEITIGGGYDLLYNEPIGLMQEVDKVQTFSEFMDLFTLQLQRAVKMQCADANLADYVHKELVALPLASIFVDGCMESGRDVTGGGARYNTTGIIGVGTANCADGLYAVRELVFERKLLTIARFREILGNNYENHAPLRQTIWNKLQKYGNDMDEVDAFAVQVTNLFFDELDHHVTFHHGAFWPTLLSITSQVGMGYQTAAGPDGRLSGETLADGLTPMYGQDKNGPTAAMKSFVKIDLMRSANGVIINQRLTSSLFSTTSGKEKVKQLLRSFVDAGGYHWQFNIIGTDVLRKAQSKPDGYRGLVVRVAGYSAIFVELSKTAQESVIARNEAAL
ncbi:MAG: glycyl radical protein [Christensenellales bacterium]